MREFSNCIWLNIHTGECRKVIAEGRKHTDGRRIVITTGNYPSLAYGGVSNAGEDGLIEVKAKCGGFNNPSQQSNCDSYYGS